MSRAVSDPRITAYLHTDILNALDGILRKLESSFAYQNTQYKPSGVRIVDRRVCCSTETIPQMAVAVLSSFPAFISIGGVRLWLLLAV
jgi:hypothetical protein